MIPIANRGGAKYSPGTSGPSAKSQVVEARVRAAGEAAETLSGSRTWAATCFQVRPGAPGTSPYPESNRNRRLTRTLHGHRAVRAFLASILAWSGPGVVAFPVVFVVPVVGP
jgi:hypothetical protein